MHHLCSEIALTPFTAKANALGIDKEKFENVCEELSRRQHLVRRTGSHHFPDRTSPQCYEFAHALYREVFYHRQCQSDAPGCDSASETRPQKLFLFQHETNYPLRGPVTTWSFRQTSPSGGNLVPTS